ncbi:hypothetical protein CRUP_011390 [Coryphaenoides rupestris]|nr:hypothetical protein CRUP_011390 [Coryphaenoides rupestris]
MDVSSTGKDHRPPAAPSDGVDAYGFSIPQALESYKELMKDYGVILNRRSLKWSKLLQAKAPIEKNLTCRRYVRKGIPNEHRGRIWMISSGAQEQLEANPGYYHSLLAAEPDTRLQESSSESGQRTALFNVLLAYGHHNPAVGYCQGMNFIAGYLLIITRDEEKSFWLMDALIGRILPGN